MFTVISDTQEKTTRWKFIKTKYCAGTIDRHLATGDYSLEGFEETFVIERKHSAAELYMNICTADSKRFHKEMVRLQAMPNSFIVCEFTMNDILGFPWKSDLPKSIQYKIGNKADFFLRRFLELQAQYRVPIILAGAEGKKVAISLFKRIYDQDHK